MTRETQNIWQRSCRSRPFVGRTGARSGPVVRAEENADDMRASWRSGVLCAAATTPETLGCFLSFPAGRDVIQDAFDDDALLFLLRLVMLFVSGTLVAWYAMMLSMGMLQCFLAQLTYTDFMKELTITTMNIFSTWLTFRMARQSVKGVLCSTKRSPAVWFLSGVLTLLVIILIFDLEWSHLSVVLSFFKLIIL